MLEFRVRSPRELSSLGDSYVNLIYSLALTKALSRPIGKKVSNHVLAKALEGAGLRRLVGSRANSHRLADFAEGLIFQSWVEGKLTLEGSVVILAENFSGSEDRLVLREESVKAFTSLLKTVAERKNMKRRKTPLLTVDAVVEKAGKVLLIRRRNPPYEGCWALPGGFVEYGEKVEDAAVRELKEETGLEIDIKGLLGVYSEPGRDPRGHVVSICFLATGRGVERGGSDAEDARFFRPAEINFEKMAFDHEKILKDYIKLKGKT